MKPFDLEIANLPKYCNEALILAVLRDEKKHGYQIALEIEKKSGGAFKFNHGTLYPILHKLEKERFIKGSWKNEGPKRKRKYYALTKKGTQYLQAQQDAWQSFFSTFFTITGESKS